MCAASATRTAPSCESETVRQRPTSTAPGPSRGATSTSTSVPPARPSRSGSTRRANDTFDIPSTRGTLPGGISRPPCLGRSWSPSMPPGAWASTIDGPPRRNPCRGSRPTCIPAKPSTSSRSAGHRSAPSTRFLGSGRPAAAAQVGSLLGWIRVPMLAGVRSDLPRASDAVFANANPQTVVQGGEAIVLAKLSGGSADPIDVRLSWTGAGAAQALERTASGTGVPLQSLLGRQWVLLKIHGMLAALRAHEDPATLDALKALATENRVVTPYTSLLVVIPRTDPGSTEASPAADRAFAGIAGGLFAAPASSGRGGPIGVFAPLEIEGREAEALRQDLANPLVAENELDRRIFAA